MINDDTIGAVLSKLLQFGASSSQALRAGTTRLGSRNFFNGAFGSAQLQGFLKWSFWLALALISIKLIPPHSV